MQISKKSPLENKPLVEPYNIDQRYIVHFMSGSYWYNVNRFSSLAGLVLWQHQEKLKPVIKLIVEQRDWLYQQLKQFSWLTVYPSKANFLLVKSQEAGLWQTLLNNGILVRQFHINGQEYLRLTVGKPEENKRLVEVLSEQKSNS